MSGGPPDAGGEPVERLSGTESVGRSATGPRPLPLRMAHFWITLFIRLSRSSPGLMRAIRPLGVRIAWWSSRPSREGTIANARWLLGPASGPRERRALGMAVMRSFYDFLLDLGRCGGMSVEELTREAESVEGLKEYREIRALGRGAIIVTAHLGSFEVGAAGLRKHEPRVHVVFRRDPMDLFESLRSEQRRRLGVMEAPVDEGWMVWVRLRDALLADEVVMMQGDRLMPGQRGMNVPFLGGHIAVPTGPARLALATGAPIIPVFSIRGSSGKIRIVLEDAVFVLPEPGPGEAVERATLAVSRAIERHVAANPAQWLMIRPVWREDMAGG